MAKDTTEAKTDPKKTGDETPVAEPNEAAVEEQVTVVNLDRQMNKMLDACTHITSAKLGPIGIAVARKAAEFGIGPKEYGGCKLEGRDSNKIGNANVRALCNVVERLGTHKPTGPDADTAKAKNAAKKANENDKAFCRHLAAMLKSRGVPVIAHA